MFIELNDFPLCGWGIVDGLWGRNFHIVTIQDLIPANKLIYIFQNRNFILPNGNNLGRKKRIIGTETEIIIICNAISV